MVVTDKEREEIKQAVIEYDKRCEAELKDEIVVIENPLKELYEEFGRVDLETIRVYQESVGILMELGIRGNSEVRQRVRNLINLETHEIEKLREDILNDRKYIEELSR